MKIFQFLKRIINKVNSAWLNIYRDLNEPIPPKYGLIYIFLLYIFLLLSYPFVIYNPLSNITLILVLTTLTISLIYLYVYQCKSDDISPFTFFRKHINLHSLTPSERINYKDKTAKIYLNALRKFL